MATNNSDSDKVWASAADEVKAMPPALSSDSVDQGDYLLTSPEIPARHEPPRSPFRRREQSPDEPAPTFFCFPLLVVVGLTLAGMMCLCPLSMFVEFPQGLLMLWGVCLIIGGIIWFGFRFKRFTGEHMTDEAPWYLRGGLATMLQLSGYVIQEPVVFGPPFCVQVMGMLLCLSPMFIPDIRPHFRRNTIAMPGPAPAPVAPHAAAASANADSGKRESGAIPAIKKTPKLAELLASDPMVYLTDLEEFDVQAGACPLGKNGALGNGSRIVVQGKESKNGLGMHPALPPHVAKASYRLGKQRATLRGGAALNDTAETPWGAAIFSIRGDGKLLWKSSPIKSRGKVSEFELDLEGIDALEMSVFAETHNHYVHAVWVEPRLIRK